MDNIIQQVFMTIYPHFKLEWFALLPAVALFLVGIFVETQYTNKLTFWLNSVTLVSYLGVKSSINAFIGLLILIFFGLSTVSFFSYASHSKIPSFKAYEDLIDKHPIILRIGGSLIVGLVLLIDNLPKK